MIDKENARIDNLLDEYKSLCLLTGGDWKQEFDYLTSENGRVLATFAIST